MLYFITVPFQAKHFSRLLTLHLHQHGTAQLHKAPFAKLSHVASVAWTILHSYSIRHVHTLKVILSSELLLCDKIKMLLSLSLSLHVSHELWSLQGDANKEMNPRDCCCFILPFLFTAVHFSSKHSVYFFLTSVQVFWVSTVLQKQGIDLQNWDLTVEAKTYQCSCANLVLSYPLSHTASFPYLLPSCQADRAKLLRLAEASTPSVCHPCHQSPACCPTFLLLLFQHIFLHLLPSLPVSRALHRPPTLEPLQRSVAMAAKVMWRQEISEPVFNLSFACVCPNHTHTLASGGCSFIGSVL